MKLVTLAVNPLDPETWTTHEVSDIRDFLVEQFEEWPSTARIYNGTVSNANDVTPSNESEIERLGQLEGPFYVIVYPAEPITIIYAIIAIVVIAAVVMAAQQPPMPTLRNTQSQSPNNELSERSNKPRPMSRIPDIFGTVRSTPDLIAFPYKIFENNEEVEYSYMCIGRGEYEVSDIRDDTTLASDISGTSVEIYSPFTSPNSGHSPQMRIGTPINTPVLTAKRSNSVNGQVLRAPDSQNIRGSQNIFFTAPNQIQTSSFDFTDKFMAGDLLVVSNSSVYNDYSLETKTLFADSDGSISFVIPSSTLPPDYTAGKELALTGGLFSVKDSDGFLTGAYNLDGVYTIESVNLVTVTDPGPPSTTTYYCRIVLASAASINPNWSAFAGRVGPKDAALRIPIGQELYNLNGTYTVLSVSAELIILSDPASVNSAWSSLTATPAISPTLLTSGPKWVGPFIIDDVNANQVFANFVALNGLYSDDGKNQYRIDVLIALEITPINNDNSPRGSAETFYIDVQGSATYRSTRARTLKASPALQGRYSIRAHRVTPSWLDFDGSVVDEVKWRDFYSVSPVAEKDFGNVTTVQSVTFATTGALALKERKLNMLATRKIPVRVEGSTFSEELYATNDAAEIFSAICLDPRIGNRRASEIDFDSIYNAVSEVRSYFGSDYAAEFCYTFDSDNLSFEETAQAVANAVFSIAYRRGNIIKLNFEKQTKDSTLLFNHRNKSPGSETRTISFGNQNDYDGVEFQYISPKDDALVTLYIPEDKSAVNPKQVESLGIRNKLQAYFHAWRTWNKIRFQKTIVEFQATQEADLLVNQDRILVADNTRPDTQDGEVIEQNVLLLTLSQNVQMQSGVDYSIFVQHVDGTTESIPIAADTTNSRRIILSRAPRLPLATDNDLYARTTFIIVGNNETRQSAFLVVEKEMQNNFVSTIRAANYDDRYYANDKDFVNSIVNENGEYP